MTLYSEERTLTMLEGALLGYLAHLRRGTMLNEAEQRRIMSLQGRIVRLPARAGVVRPGMKVDRSILVVDGLLARFDLMSDGARQITAFYIPGDMFDLHSAASPRSGWGIASLSAATIYEVPHAEVLDAFDHSHAIARAFWRYTTLDASILAKWVANMGRKSADKRIAHLLCEMAVRSERAGVGTLTRYPLAATQEQLGDATGLTSVHVNRMLRLLRDDHGANFERGRVVIEDWQSLSAFADFDSTYLL